MAEALAVAKSVLTAPETLYKAAKKLSKYTGIAKSFFTSKKDRFFADYERANDEDIYYIETLLKKASLVNPNQKREDLKVQLRQIKGMCAKHFATGDQARFIDALGYYWLTTNLIYTLDQFSLDEYKENWFIDLEHMFRVKLTGATSLVLRPTVLKVLNDKKYKQQVYDLLRAIRDTVVSRTTEGRQLMPEEDQTKGILVKSEMFSILHKLPVSDPKKDREKWQKLVAFVLKEEPENDSKKVLELQKRIHDQRNAGTFDSTDGTKPNISQHNVVERPSNLSDQQPSGPEGPSTPGAPQLSLGQRAAAIFDGLEIKQLMVDTVNPSGLMSYLSGCCLPRIESDAIKNTAMYPEGGSIPAVQRLLEGIKKDLTLKEDHEVGQHLRAIIDAFELSLTPGSKLIRLLREAMKDAL